MPKAESSPSSKYAGKNHYQSILKTLKVEFGMLPRVYLQAVSGSSSGALTVDNLLSIFRRRVMYVVNVLADSLKLELPVFLLTH
jgi:hypothetical protein